MEGRRMKMWHALAGTQRSEEVSGRPYLPVSVVVPTKNEEANLGRCLRSLEGFDEVIVVDSDSTDSTKSIAAAYHATVLNFKWNGIFPKKRNWCLRSHRCRNEWVLFVDADEYVTEAFKREIAVVIENTKLVGFWVTYENRFMGRRLRHGVRFRKLSIFRLGSGEYEQIDEEDWSELDMEVHEHPVLCGKVGRLSSRIIHEDFKGLGAFIARHNEYASWEAHRYLVLRSDPKVWRILTPRQRIKYRLMNTWCFAPGYFLYSYFALLGFLDAREGFVFSLLKLMYFLQVKIRIGEAFAAAPPQPVLPF